MKKLAWMFPLLIEACSSDPATPANAGSADAARGDAADVEEPADSGAASCMAAREQLLKPIDTVSSGEVSVLSDEGGTKTIYVDASAGGAPAASANPRLYLNLQTASKAGVTDATALMSTDWDLAIKRPILFANNGDGGAGQGGALLVAQDFDNVTAADAAGQTLLSESFFEADCTPKVDATGAVKTSFDGWYDYDQSTNLLTPHPGTWLVRGGTGKLYKVQILSYYATPDGGAGQAGGRYTLKIGAL